MMMIMMMVVVMVMVMVVMAVMMKMTMKKIRMRKIPARDFSLPGLVKMSTQRTRDWAAVCKITLLMVICHHHHQYHHHQQHFSINTITTFNEMATIMTNLI